MTTFSSNATTLTLLPSSTDIGKGWNVDFEVVVSDFGSDGIGGFSFEVDYDSDILAFDHWTMADGLGNVGIGEAMDLGSGEVADGIAQCNGSSLLGSEELIALQKTDQLTLGSISFRGIESGTGNVAFNPSFTVVCNANAAAIDVSNHEGASVNVPEPSSLLLSLSGLMGLLGCGAFRKKTN
jgi:hypothetical protein